MAQQTAAHWAVVTYNARTMEEIGRDGTTYQDRDSARRAVLGYAAHVTRTPIFAAVSPSLDAYRNDPGYDGIIVTRPGQWQEYLMAVYVQR